MHAKAIALNLGPKWGWQEKVWAMWGRFKTKEEREDGAGRCLRQRGRRGTKSGCGAQLGQQRRNQIRCERMVSYLGARRQLFQRSNCAGSSRQTSTEFNFNREQ